MNMKKLAQIKEALQLALIYIQQAPSESAPTKELRAALSTLDEVTETAQHHQSALKGVLESIYDPESGAVLRPHPEIVEKLRKEIEGAEQ